MNELLVKYTPDTLAHAPFYGPATPSEIAAAHPKCGAPRCKYWRDSGMYDVGSDERIGNCPKLPGLQAYEGFYCSHHTELTGAPDDTE